MALAGCGPESTSDSSYNPATAVSRSFETFETRNDEGMPEVLPQTIFYNFYVGLEPADGEDDGGVADALRERLELLMGLTPSDDRTRYTIARNPLDFLNHIISTNQVDNFDQGRQLMRDSITDGDAARYNTGEKNALIRFTETGDNNGEDPEPDQRWVYNLLDWQSNPQANKIYRSAQFIARPADDDEPDPAEVESAIWSSQFHGPDFSVSGYNQPEYAAASMTGRSLGNVEFWQEFIGNKSDTLILTETEITIDGEDVSYVCAEIDYENSRVKVYTESQEGQSPDGEENPALSLNPVDCDVQGAGDPIEYNTVDIPGRQ